MPAQAQADIKKQLPEAPLGLFRPTLVYALNALAAPYVRWLASDAGRAFCKQHVGAERTLPLAPPKGDMKLETTEDYLDGW